MPTYRVFTRSVKSWEDFSTANKRTVQRGLSYHEARDMCQEGNNDRTNAQKNRGFKYEFETEGE